MAGYYSKHPCPRDAKGKSIHNLKILGWLFGPVHTYPEICENAIFFFPNTACVHTYPAYFPAVSGNF